MEKKMLILSNVWVEPNSSAAGWRMLRLIQFLQDQAFQIHYATTASQSGFETDLRAIGITCHEVRVNDEGFDAFVRTLAPDIVLYDRFMVEEQFSWRVAKQLPETLQVLDTEDLHALRYAREAAVKEDRSFELKDIHRQILYRELAAIHRCDLSLIISEFEMELLTEELGVSNQLLHYLPFHVDKLEVSAVEQKPLFESRSDFITIGNFRHGPNRDAVSILKDKVWPQIRMQLPEAQLRVYGAYANAAVKQWHRPKEGFHLMGRAEKLKPILESARVMLAPLRYGAGLKGKLIDAMRCGLPSVSTAIGAEGIAVPDEWPGYVSDSWDVFVKQAIRLHEDEGKWMLANSKSKAALAKFCSDQPETDFVARISSIQKNLPEYRRQNWIGQMLKLQTTKSLEYLSKWITEKNK